MTDCVYCSQSLNPTDPSNWHQVTVWVHGYKRNGACMQGDDVLAMMHDGCARLARDGINPNQGTMF